MAEQNREPHRRHNRHNRHSLERILVTGATGKVGAALLNELARLEPKPSIEVIAAVRNPERATEQRIAIERQKGWTIRALDFHAPETFDSALERVTKCFLMRPPAIGNVKRDMFPFLTAASKFGVHHIVLLSLLGAEKRPYLPHRKLEKEILRSGIPHTFLRAGFFMQNLNTQHRDEIRDHGEIVVPAGSKKTAFIDVRDIAAVAARALCEPGHKGNAYELTGAEALDYDEVASLLTEVLGRTVTYAHPSFLSFIRHLHRQGVPRGLRMVMCFLYLGVRFGNARMVSDDVERILGRRPITFEEYARDHRDQWNR